MRVCIFGGGHNGLVTAALLARQGASVQLFEKRHLGGALEDFGFPNGDKVGRGANVISLLDPAALELLGCAKPAEFYRYFQRPDPQVLHRTVEGDALFPIADDEATASSLADQTGEPLCNIRVFFEHLALASSVVRDLWTCNRATSTSFAEALRRADSRFPELFLFGSLTDTVLFYFKTAVMRVLFSYSALLEVSPVKTFGTAYHLLYLSGNYMPSAPFYVVPRFGMGALADLFVNTAVSSGVELSVDEELTELVVDNGKVARAVLGSGKSVEADCYISGFGPTQLGQIVRTTANNNLVTHRHESACAKLFATLPSNEVVKLCGFGPPFPGLLRLYPPEAMLEDGVLRAMRGLPCTFAICELSLFEAFEAEPATWVEGRSVSLSIYAQFFPYEWCVKDSAASVQQTIIAAVKNTMSLYSESAARYLHVAYVLASRDLERDYGMQRGDVDHGMMDATNRFESRGFGSLPHGSTPWSNLFNASAGGYPGGLVTARPGIICATTAMEYWQSGHSSSS